MVLNFLLWLIDFLILYIAGFAILQFFNRVFRIKHNFEFSEYFFTGFVSISILTGYLSLVFPVNQKILIYIAGVLVIYYFLNTKMILMSLKKALSNLISMPKIEFIILILFIVFVLATVSSKISWGDTGLYHSQAIQWIRKYSVVPGLGNIHGRLAFNSMFFVISGLFTFEIRDILIYPLNSLCFLILSFRLIKLYKFEYERNVVWKSVLYALMGLYSLLLFAPNLNSASPDVITSILVIYIFTFVFDFVLNQKKISYSRLILISTSVFCCIGMKISSLLLVGTILFFIDWKRPIKPILLVFITGLIAIIPFMLRNYYLSGYLIYPYPGIDIFSVDWKIPVTETVSMKAEIEGWAKMSQDYPYPEVMKANLRDWIIPWFLGMNFINKVLVITNFSAVITFILMLIRKENILALVQLIIILNIVFWILTAPDPRFLYGFLVTGFSFIVAYIIMFIEKVEKASFIRKLRFLLGILLLIIFLRRISIASEIVLSPSYWIIPAPEQTAETITYSNGFIYHVSNPEGENCFNTEIPCVPYHLNNIELRGKSLSEGFRVADITKNK
jgi:hypothetical protein